MVMSMIPTHLTEEMDGFLWTVTHWCTKEDTFSMHGPQGWVKQEIGSGFKKRLSQQEWGINQWCALFQVSVGCGGSFQTSLGFDPLWTRVSPSFSGEKQQVMFEPAGDVRRVRAGWPSLPRFRENPQLRVIAQYWRAHWPLTFFLRGGTETAHGIWGSHTYAQPYRQR